MFVALKCPDCGYHKVYGGRGRCRCGSYLIHHWGAMNRGAKLILPRGRVWMRHPDGEWRLAKDEELRERQAVT